MQTSTFVLSIRKNHFLFALFCILANRKNGFATFVQSCKFRLSNPLLRKAQKRSVQLPKKFRLKFWILILQKSEKNSHLNLTKFNRKKIFMKTKLKKINAWKFAVENLQTEKICCLTMKKNEKLFEKLPKIFFENEIWKVLTF